MNLKLVQRNVPIKQENHLKIHYKHKKCCAQAVIKIYYKHKNN